MFKGSCGVELADRVRRGLQDTGAVVISKQTTRRTRHVEPDWRDVVANRRLFGDESDLHFWTVASHYLQSFAQARQLSVSTAEGQAKGEGTQHAPQNHLDICNDVLCESPYFQVSEN